MFTVFVKLSLFRYSDKTFSYESEITKLLIYVNRTGRQDSKKSHGGSGVCTVYEDVNFLTPPPPHPPPAVLIARLFNPILIRKFPDPHHYIYYINQHPTFASQMSQSPDHRYPPGMKWPGKRHVFVLMSVIIESSVYPEWWCL